MADKTEIEILEEAINNFIAASSRANEIRGYAPKSDVLVVEAAKETLARQKASAQGVDLEDLAHEIWAAAQLLPDESILDGVARIINLIPTAPLADDKARPAQPVSRIDAIEARKVLENMTRSFMDEKPWQRTCRLLLEQVIGNVPVMVSEINPPAGSDAGRAEALKALDAWTRDPDRFTSCHGLTKAEEDLCDNAEIIRAALADQDAARKLVSTAAIAGNRCMADSAEGKGEKS